MGQKQVLQQMFPKGQSVRNQEKATWKGDGTQLGIHQSKNLDIAIKQTTRVLVICHCHNPELT